MTQARELAERIAAVDAARVACDRAWAAAAVEEHLVALGLQPLPVRWALGPSPPDDWTLELDRAWWLARSHARAAAKKVAKTTLWWPLRETTFMPAIVQAWAAVAGLAQPANPVSPWLEDAIVWASAPEDVRRIPAVARWLEACTPFVDAYEAGLGFFWILGDEVVCVPRPALDVEREVLHSATGPAVVWADGRSHWFWRGLPVAQHVIEAPDRISVDEVHKERNLELRRVLLERMGYDRYLRKRRARLLHEDECGRLWVCGRLPDEREPLVLIEVENATTEADGTRKRYFLRVPPWMRTARQAVAWTFEIDQPKRYRPTVET